MHRTTSAKNLGAELGGGLAENVGAQHGARDLAPSCSFDFFAQLPSGVLAAVKDMADVVHGAVALLGDSLLFRRAQRCPVRFEVLFHGHSR